MGMHKLHLHATNRCTNYCKHCSVEAGPTGPPLLDGADFRYLVDWASEAGAKWLEISGGEPLTLGDALFELIAYAHDKSLYVSLLTNGCMIDEQGGKRLRTMGAERIGISLYGAIPVSHDDFTQTPGSFSKALTGIHAVADAGFEVVVNVIVTPKNVDELHLLPSLLTGIDLYTFGSVVPSGRGSTLTKYAFSEQGYRRAIEKLERAFTGVPYLFLSSLSPTPSTDLERYCVRPRIETTVNHEGHRVPCCLLPRKMQYPTGNVKNRNFHELTDDDLVYCWLERGHKALREHLQSSEGSHNLCKNCINMLDAVTLRRQGIQ
jgi:MoaA/NifB/PqqE/SkfB family radical SAM enzyme